MDTADILPTLFNMLGISYHPSYYVGTDIFSENHENFVYFSNDVFYDGKTLYDSNAGVENATVDVDETMKKIKTKIELNNNFIISDYFKDK